ncbi:1-(5-phosphoribosyl)-5-[(5-phosphoribosylamino)methylideneamino]imidazole-4-carboxamide isomerase [Desulfurella sp.]|uniref:1-(5-phosphoribosyl)-5-[(5- phosphoribosylamino)methylideneamino]imidazole-4- carboxamide isomerase n=1 Tax=Desulfurella sp. TaxID=1962857 RepID=UPI003D0A5AC9
MLVVPAIDLIDSKVVRLTKGKAESAKEYSQNPIEFALYFESLGFKRIHIVDLDAAFNRGNNLDIIYKIAKNSNIELEIGGGIRNFDIAQKIIDSGVKRIVIGSLPFKNKAEFEKILKSFLEYIVIGVDVENNKVKISGWEEETQVECVDFLKQALDWGISEAIVTDISKDGMLSGIDENFYGQIAKKSSIGIIASGGIKNIEDLMRLKKCEKDGLNGAIIGKAIYEGTIDLSQIHGGQL